MRVIKIGIVLALVLCLIFTSAEAITKKPSFDVPLDEGGMFRISLSHGPKNVEGGGHEDLLWDVEIDLSSNGVIKFIYVSGGGHEDTLQVQISEKSLLRIHTQYTPENNGVFTVPLADDDGTLVISFTEGGGHEDLYVVPLGTQASLRFEYDTSFCQAHMGSRASLMIGSIDGGGHED